MTQKKSKIDLVLFFVLDKKDRKVKNIEIVSCNDEASKAHAIMHLKKRATKATEVIMSIKAHDILGALPLYSNYAI